MSRSIWTLFSGQSVEGIMDNQRALQRITDETNRRLPRGYYAEWRLTRTGLYLNVRDNRGREFGHLSCHNSASAEGSMSHVVAGRGRGRDVRFEINRGRIQINTDGQETANMAIVLRAAASGLGQMGDEGAFRGGGDNSEDLEISFVITDIPIDENFLINLILSKFILEKNLLIDYAQISFGVNSNFVNKTISLNDLIKNDDEYLSYINIIKESLNELSEYTKIFESKLKNELLNNPNKIILEYIFLDSDINTSSLLPKEDKNIDNKELDNYKSKYIKYKSKYYDLKKIK